MLLELIFFQLHICRLYIFEFRHSGHYWTKVGMYSRYIFGWNQNSSITSKFRIEAAFKDILSAFFVNPQVPVYYWRQNSKRKMRGQKGVPLWRQKHMLDQKRERKKKLFWKTFSTSICVIWIRQEEVFFCVCVCV